MPVPFLDKLRAAQAARGSRLCVGLDPDPERLPRHLTDDAASPAEAAAAFCCAVVEATRPYACAYKPNLAFFEVLGADGWRALERVLAAVPADAITVADAKRGDIGNSARFYARALYEHLGCDACTVAPYMGRDAVLPFLQHPGKAAFVLARTSNPGSADLQERPCEGAPLYLHVARQVAAWSREAPGTAGLVAGATAPAALAELRAACPGLPFLIPGVGAQGGDAGAVLDAAGRDAPLLVNSSRSILYASPGRDFAEAAAHQARLLRDQLSD